MKIVRRTWAVWTVLAAALLAGGPAAYACSCAPLVEPPCLEFERTPVIFIGRVAEVQSVDFLRMRVRFDFEYLFQGPEVGSLTIESFGGSAACGIFDFAPPVGQPWLVYAYGTEEPFGASMCSRTRPLPDNYEESIGQIFYDIYRCEDVAVK